MAFRVGSWNIHNGFSDGSKVEPIVMAVDRMGVDAIIFPEAYDDNQENTDALEEALESLKILGYKALSHSYDDQNNRSDQHGFVWASRITGTTTFEPLGERLAAYSVLTDPDTDTAVEVYGAHLDDRSEKKRLEAIKDLKIDGIPTILAGDLNSMDRHDYRVHVLGSNVL
jgi:endonuclease/exonuclease/phosphatase family metal-dependent hydrolase